MFSTIHAYEPSMLSLDIPSYLKTGRGDFNTRHRFLGTINDPFENLLGSDDGSNVSIEMRYKLTDHIELYGLRISDFMEYNFGVSYNYMFEPIKLNSQVKLIYFTEKYGTVDERQNNFFYQLNFARENIWDRLTLVTNLGYDGYNLRLSTGFGAMLKLSKKYYLLGEVYPLQDPNEKWTGSYSGFAFGFKYKTVGHHFAFQLSNVTNIGIRKASLGSNTKDLFLGFNMQRILRFKKRKKVK